MSMEHWWNDTDRGKLKYKEKNLSQCHFVHQESPMEDLGLMRGRQSVVAHLVVLRCTYLEKFRNVLKRLALNQMRNGQVLCTSRTLRAVSTPLHHATRERLQCSCVSSFHSSGLGRLNKTTKCLCHQCRPNANQEC